MTYKGCNNAGECSQLSFSVTAAARTFNPPGATYTTLATLQTAINNDIGGSDFVLAPGNYSGTLELTKRAGAMTRIRCASGYGLPQVRTTDTAGMCVITPNVAGQPALTTVPTTGSSTAIGNYFIEGFAFQFEPGANLGGSRVPVVRLGFDDNETFNQLPKNITLRHCHIWIPDDANASQGVRPNARHVAVLDSTVKNIHYVGVDSQAIFGWHGMYGLWVDNCHLNADTEVAGAGGSTSKLMQRPEAITYRRTHFYKPESWTNSASRLNKNIFQLKTGRSVNVDACIMETTDGDDSQGYPITLTAYREPDGRNDTIEDVSFTRLKVKNTPSFATVCSDCGGRPSLGLEGLGGPSGGEVRRVRFEDIVLDNQENVTRTGLGVFLRVLTSGADSLPIDRLSLNRITAPLNYIERGPCAFMQLSTPAERRMTNFSFTNVVGNSVCEQIHSSVGKGSVALEAHTSGGYTWAGNVIAGITLNPPKDDGSNAYPANRDLIGFVDLRGGVGGNYRLLPGNQYEDNGTGGSRPGADIDAIEASIQGVEIGAGFITPPASPSNLTITGSPNAGLTLNWTDNSSDETGFVLERRFGSNKTASGKSVTVGPNVGTYTLQPFSVNCATQIFYRVYALNGSGSSGYSNEVRVDGLCGSKWSNLTNSSETDTTIGHNGGAARLHAAVERGGDAGVSLCYRVGRRALARSRPLRVFSSRWQLISAPWAGASSRKIIFATQPS